MSLLQSELATYGRMSGLYRFLLHHPGQAASRVTLEALLSPPSLVAAKSNAAEPAPVMLMETLSEALKMGLFVEVDGLITFAAAPSSEIRDLERGEGCFRRHLARLILTDTSENDRLALILAWFLTLDPATGITSQRDFQERITGDPRLAPHLRWTNDVIIGQFEHWVCDLGFAWRWGIPSQGKGSNKMWVPDPTGILLETLPGLLPEVEREETFGSVLSALAEQFPVFEMGRHRAQVEAWIGKSPERHLSASSAMAWFRLEELGRVHLRMAADAEGWILPDGDSFRKVSHVVRKEARA